MEIDPARFHAGGAQAFRHARQQAVHQLGIETRRHHREAKRGAVNPGRLGGGEAHAIFDF
ncbi:MAG: hypothetical protein WDM96_10595 [Lacunisphaera sp.]